MKADWGWQKRIFWIVGYRLLEMLTGNEHPEMMMDKSTLYVLQMHKRRQE